MRWITAALVVSTVVATAQDATAAQSQAANSEARLAAIGLQVAPVPLNFAGRNRRVVGLGSYLVNLATCSGCHTNPEYAPGHNPFQGQEPKIDPARYLAGGTKFGTVVSANIRPDRRGRPAGLSYAQFVQVMRHGRDPDQPGRLLQVMPWPAYRYLTDHHLRAMYAYLSATPPLPAKP
jgi:hypothetical protein